MKQVKIFLGSDHAGFKLKEKIKSYLEKLKIRYEDLGPHKLNPKDDYPDYAFKVAKKATHTPNSRGIFICSSGTGGAIASNKVKGIRAVAAYDSFTAKFSRMDNNTNILCLRARNFPFDKTKQIISTWLKTPFSEKPRHKRRIKKITEFEK